MGLRISTKNAIRSKEFIKYLNNLGHCINYDTVLRIDNSWAMGIMNEGEGYSTVPSNIQPNIYLRKQLLVMMTMVKRMLLSMSQTQCCISTHKAVFRMWIGLLQCHMETDEDQLIFILREWTSEEWPRNLICQIFILISQSVLMLNYQAIL